ncbi:peptidylprolyl isomerase [Acidiphilium acidophilum]|uniref:peptidylprolyl isomerase n=1 Tax=Acidiphilium acidophilum TaxID=76588 RepID=UPI002E8E71C4|nr:peptidylprolyl isomerase [Acidiphilium acidophilum]
MKSLLRFGFSLGLGALCLAPLHRGHAQDAQNAGGARIAVVVNGAVITNQDVDARARLFALSAGLPQNPEVLDRLKPQITSELIDQALQLQAIERHKVVVPQDKIAAALARIDKANGLPPGGLQKKLAAVGIPYSTLVQQFRTELGWTDVLKKELGENLRPTREDVLAEQRAMKHELGQTQYHVAEIFIPIERPSDEANAKRFADTVIKQLRNGAPFPVVAAQFSQSQSALTGGDRGWVAPDLLDPAVRAIVERMPAGAISDPVRVAGGFEIVNLLGTRKFGEVKETTLHIRQVFLPFPAPFQGGQPTAGQLAVLSHATAMRGGLHDCSAVSAANAAAGNVRKADPGPVNLATVQPAAFQSLLSGLPIGQISQPLVSHNGVALVMVCSRQTSTTGLPSLNEIGSLLIQRRVSLESQQLMDTLHRNAVIQREPG